MKSKLKSLSSILRIVRRLRKEGKKIGFTNGCFDILHRGHVDYLSKAKGFVDVLIVGLNSDKSVRKIKGRGRPINKEEDRAALLSALEVVDYIVIFDEETPYNLIKTIKPDYLFKGADWDLEKVVGRDIVESYGGKVVLLPYLKGYSTSSLIKKICRKVC
jgi:D-beta-D-heptose 7-phosphate kinase/D-beta-D-heptose 1-phosphate adenosyltransferase